jgi:hypothetical protein
MHRLAMLLLALAASAPAQELSDAHRRALDEERRVKQLERSSAEESRAELARPRQAGKDAKACESARVYYQTACGAPYSPRSRSLRCAEANAMYRQSC